MKPKKQPQPIIALNKNPNNKKLSKKFQYQTKQY